MSFTIKEFFDNNKKCVCCKSKTSIDIEKYKEGIAYKQKYSTNNDVLYINFKTEYRNSSEITINTKLNSFVFNGDKSHIYDYKYYFIITCLKCNYYLVSKFIDFNFDSNFISALDFALSYHHYNDSNNGYGVRNNYESLVSEIYVYANNKTQFNCSVNLIPKDVVDDKDKLINKIKTYMTFS